MPTYRYRCESCGDDFELWQSITDDALTTHDPSVSEGGCGGHVVKVLSPAGIVLKGSGFYKTDSRGSRSSKNGDGTKDSTSSDGGSSDSGSKDSGSKDSGSKGSGSKSSDAKSGSSDSKSSDSKTGSSGSGSSSKPSKSGSTA